MRGTARHVARAVAAAAVLGALGFGGAQAFAAPAAARAMAARTCVGYTCSTACFQKGYTGWYCFNGVCHCTYDPPPQ